MDQLTAELGLVRTSASTGFNYRPRHTPDEAQYSSGVGVYATDRGVEVQIGIFCQFNDNEVADRFQEVIARLTGCAAARNWPSFPVDVVAADWARFREELVKPYFAERDKLAAAESGSGS
ncbi:MAG: hypothetical protein U0T02_03060 [Solirubrobacteraceae bacterium]